MAYMQGLSWRSAPTAKSIARHAAEGLRFRERDPELAAALRRAEENNILEDLCRQLQARGTLSEKQVALAKKIATDLDVRAAKRAEAALTAVPVVAGKRVLEGTVVSAKWHDGGFGTALKCILQTVAGERLWGTVPAEVKHAVGTDDPKALVGVQMRFTATVEVANGDPGFGFWKRPTKAELIGGAA